MVVPSEFTKEIQEFFQPLNPYSFETDIFKIEREDIWFYGISAKRYCLYNIENNEIKIENEDYSSHGLGHLLDPFTDDPDEKDDWHKIIWKDILDLHYGKISMEQLFGKYQNKCCGILIANRFLSFFLIYKIIVGCHIALIYSAYCSSVFFRSSYSSLVISPLASLSFSTSKGSSFWFDLVF